jgi:hypothetical protein
MLSEAERRAKREGERSGKESKREGERNEPPRAVEASLPAKSLHKKRYAAHIDGRAI